MIERLIGALSEIRRRYKKDKAGMIKHEYINPIVVTTPQEAFYSDMDSIALENSAGRVSGEFIMAYPPGIPILAPGERITEEIIERILYSKKKGCSLTGPEDMNIEKVKVLKGDI